MQPAAVLQLRRNNRRGEIQTPSGSGEQLIGEPSNGGSVGDLRQQLLFPFTNHEGAAASDDDDLFHEWIVEEWADEAETVIRHEKPLRQCDGRLEPSSDGEQNLSSTPPE